MLRSTEQRTPRRAVTISRRIGLALGLAAVMTGGVAVAGGSPASAAPVCGEERAYVYQTTSAGTPLGPNINSLNPGEFNISNSATSTRYVFAAGVHRPRRSILFTFIDQNNAIVKSYPTTQSDDGGVVRQERNVFAYDFTATGSRVSVYANIRTRCGGDDVPKTVYVGAINTTP